MAVFDLFKAKKQEDADKKLEDVLVSSIIPNPGQPRKTFDDVSIQELAQSIKQVGLIQPLVVRKAGDTYELIAGERRLRALKLLGYEKATCIVQTTVVDEASAMMALIENLQREDLHFFEEALSYQELINAYSITQEQLAERIGKSQSFIANKLRVLKLPDTVKDAIVKGNLSERHARALLKLGNEDEQIELAKKTSDEGLSVKDLERLIEKTLNDAYDKKRDGAKPRPVIIRMVKDYRIFVNTVNQAVQVLRESGLSVDVAQEERENGVDINIKVTRPD
ncbi:MAG: ParB/RepB/Spo0J family partition protein [Clostridia bacterium]|nr:ParB/RepB/Spo0J family partition protein [Clostridia bacterium]